MTEQQPKTIILHDESNPPPVCTWEQDLYHDAWKTECGGLFQVMNGTPRENGMLFCPYCGRAIDEEGA